MGNNIFLFDCSECKTRCDGISKLVYHFESDSAFSNKFESLICEDINMKTSKIARITKNPGYPDIEIFNKNSQLIAYLEVKAQRRTFMSVNKLLPNSNLNPSETIALNLSDLLRYFDIYNNINVPIYIVWVLSNRPCILKMKENKLFFQDINILKNIYLKYLNKRRFTRKSGKGDVVNGKHMGVVVNYHFSLNELKTTSILNFLEALK
jgi:hypothetical protein